tara:strand:+ start:1426 stop:1770 length:345 start_codon:yes stop_codon:yes gene_type:complete
MNEIKVISLNQCPYSMAAEDLINNIKNTENSKINVNIINVSQEAKSKYQKGEIKTFPQIYYNDILIGGYDDFNEIYLKVKGTKSLDEMIEILDKKTKMIERKDKLRLIKFLISE